MVTILVRSTDIEHHGKLCLGFAICAVLKYWRSVQRIVRLRCVEQLALKIVNDLISNT